jgi:serine phosphatase RsbU (regulator of sigma subunit)
MLDGEGGDVEVVGEPLDGEWGALLQPGASGSETPLLQALHQHRTVEVATASGRTFVFPLQSAGRGVGALVLGFGPAAADVDPSSVNGFAAQVALSVDRARRREIEHDVSLTLQRTLLAAAPADSERLAVALRYRPSSDQMLVGGDFFDVINVADGSTLLVIGDVVGHGLEAATTMGQLKVAIRAFALESASPAAIMTRLDEFVSTQLEAARYTTAVLALVDTDAATIRYSIAGHPPPLLCPPGGTVARIPTPGEALLGLPPRGGRTELEVALEPGATAICLYTDGLIERPDLPLDEGISRLAQTIGAGNPAEVDVTAEHIMELVDGLPRRDDVALLYAVVRR